MLLTPPGIAASRSAFASLSPATAGRLLTITAFAATACGGVLAKTVYATGATPVSFLVIRLTAAVGVLALLNRGALWTLPARRRWTLVALGLGFGLQTLAYYSAVSLAPVGLVVVVVSTYPIVVVAMDAVIDRRLPSAGRTAVMAAALMGLWVAAGRPSGTPDLGLVLALGSAVSYAVYLRLSQRTLTGVKPMVATAWVMVGALVVVSAVAVATQPAWPSAAGIGLSVAHGLFTTTVPIVAVYAALQRLTVADIAALGPLEPIMATTLAAVVLGEALGVGQLVGGLIVVVAVTRLAGVRPRAGLPRLPFAVPRTGPRTGLVADHEVRRADLAFVHLRRELLTAATADRLHRAER
ncbi:DMT family transporter [soil metagenome]